MQINVTTRHGHLNEATQEKFVTKAEKLLRLFDRLSAIEVVVDLKDANKPRVDVNVSAEHKHDFVSHDQGDNLIAVFDSALHKMEQQLRRYKDKVQTRNRDASVKRIEDDTAAGETAEAVADDSFDDSDD
ncbi:ribosome hibernation promoting factor HPF [Posidoniimonas polymericola]|uniref:Ribosome hibernation promoting factor HPF n=1 Tax=Posidoniimonas polymericola TaxID=2528002 RepID=A0A5C5ZG08_9BACT|nr:ribosome-associated translation inhibitor RaiA [Posidoniimonas polymericola]TWT85503.1 ribosome hibernation promoting factor HPF [Posidoniimonas polymericola]